MILPIWKWIAVATLVTSFCDFGIFPQQYSENCWTSENEMDSVEMILG